MKRYKKIYSAGGLMELIPAISALGTNLVDAIEPPNQYGRQSLAANLYKGSFSGGTLGMIAGAINAGRQKKAETTLRSRENTAMRQAQMGQYQTRAMQDPYLHSGNPGQDDYFATGGSLRTMYMQKKAHGGSLSQISSDTVEVKGPSHANGGVYLPEHNAEVEGGETIKGDYVLSKKLGFAQMHRPIAKAIGILEKKPVTNITTGSLERLRAKEQALMLMQEYVKHKNNLQ